MKIIKLSEEKLKRKKKQRSSAELHEVLPVLKLFKDKKTEKKLLNEKKELLKEKTEKTEKEVKTSPQPSIRL